MLSAGLGVSCFLTWPLHCNLRLNKTKFFVEFCDAIATCAQNPGHLFTFTHCCFHKCTPDTLAAMRLGHNKHGNVAVGYTVTERAQEADNLAVFNRDQSHLRSRQQFPKLLRVRNAMLPTARGQQLARSFYFRW